VLLLSFSRTALPQPSSKRDVNNPAVAKLIDNVRRAVSYNNIRKLKYGFTVEEFPLEASNTNGFVYTFGNDGRLRREGTGQNRNPFVFDGKDGWSVDPRAEITVANSQSGREKLLFPTWIRSGWWLDKNAPLAMSILPNESDEKNIAIAMKFTGGLVGAKLFVNRATWLPSRLVVEYSAGPYTVELSDYQETLGFRYPRQIKTNYRNSDSFYKVKSVSANSADKRNLFAGFISPKDTNFDNGIPAEIAKIAKGEGEGGHYFVRPLIDGREVGPFHFDSGNPGMLIDAKIADELKMPILSSTQLTGNDGKIMTVTVRRGKTFQLGRLTINNPLYLASDLSDFSAPRREKRAGLVGYPLFARAVVEFGRGGERIALYDPASYKLPNGKWQELIYAAHTPAFYARLEGDHRGLFMLDTGASGTVFLYSKFTKEHGLLEGRKTSEMTGSGSGGGTLTSMTGQIEWFELAGYRFKNPTVEFSIEGEGVEQDGIQGIIGRDFMKQFQTIVFNFPQKKIAFIQ
jgi:hypothetical protein